MILKLILIYYEEENVSKISNNDGQSVIVGQLRWIGNVRERDDVKCCGWWREGSFGVRR